MTDNINGGALTNQDEEYSQVVEYFEQWLKFLKQSLEFIQRKSDNNRTGSSEPTSTTTERMDPVDLVARLSANQMNSDLRIPQWITMLQENNLGSKEKLMNLILTADEIRSRLIRVKLPIVMGQIERLQKDYLDLIHKAKKEKDSIETNENHINSSSSSLNHSDPIATVLHYLSGIDETRKDEVVQLCCLADANSRLSSTNSTDIAYIENWIQEKKSSLEKSTKMLEFLRSRHTALEELNTRPNQSEPGSSPSSLSSISAATAAAATTTLSSDLNKTSRVSGSQMNQLILPSVPTSLNRGSSMNLNFPQILDPANPPLLLTNNEKGKSSCLSILQREYDIQSSQINMLVEREREAKKAWEEAQAALAAASGSMSSIKTALETTLQRQQLMADITQKRIELESYNVESYRIASKIFEDLKLYLQDIKQRVEQGDVKRDLPLMFSQIIDSFCARWLKISPNQGFPHHSQQQQSSKAPVVQFDGSTEGIQGMNVIMTDTFKEEVDPLNGVNQLSSLARIGLEMTRLWKQLNEVDTDEMWRAIMQFEAVIHTRILSVVKSPSPLDKDSSHIPRYTDATVVLFYDHLTHITPKTHFECAMRTTVSLRALQEQQSKIYYYSSDFRNDDDEKKTHRSRSRKLEFLSCNRVVSPPLWALPLTHGSGYLQTLCQIAEKARELNAIIPLDISYEYEYMDDFSLENSEADAVQEKIPPKLKSEIEFTLSSDLDGILGEQKTKLVGLLKADGDDLLIMQALKKPPPSTSNATGRTRAQAQPKIQKIETPPVETPVVKNDPPVAESRVNVTYQPSELRQLIADWESGVVSDDVLEAHVVDVMTYLCRVIGSQKAIAKAMNVAPPTFAAWLNRKTIPSVTKLINNSSRDLLKEAPFDDLCQRFRPIPRPKIPKYTSNIDDSNEPSSNRLSSEISRSVKDHVEQSNDMEVVESPRSTKSEKNYPSASTKPFPKSSHPAYPYAMYSFTAQDEYRGTNSKRPPRATKESNSLRHIVQALSYRERITDDDIARELSQKFEPTKAVMIVNWKSYRIPAATDAKMNFYIMLWIQEHRHQLLESENKALSILEEHVEKLSTHGKDSSPTMNTSNDIFQDILKDSYLQDLDLNAPLKKIDSESDQISGEFNQPNEVDSNDLIAVNHETTELNEPEPEPELELVAEIEPASTSEMAVVEPEEKVDSSSSPPPPPSSLPPSSSPSPPPLPPVQQNHSTPPDTNENGSDPSLLSVPVLRQHVLDELNRRGIRQSVAVSEANLSIIGLGQPAISLLLHKTECKPGEKGITFRRLMQDWLNNSRLLPGEAKPTHEGRHHHEKNESKSELPPGTNEFVDSIKAEIQRRKLFHSSVMKEAKLERHGFGASSFSKFLSDGSCDNFQLFRTLMEQWLIASTKRQTEPEPDMGENNSESEVENDEEEDEEVGDEDDDQDGEEAEEPTEYINPAHLLSLTRLHSLMTREMQARGIKQKDILLETNDSTSYFRSSLSNFITGYKCANSEKGYLFRRKLERWLKQSQEQYGTAPTIEEFPKEEVAVEIHSSNGEPCVDAKALKQAMKSEIRRRGVKRDDVLKEAGILGHGFKHSYVRLLAAGECVSSTRGAYFRDKMEQWLKSSITKSPSAEALSAYQGKIINIKDDLIGEFTKLSISHENAYNLIKFDHPGITLDLFRNYLESNQTDSAVKTHFDNMDISYSFVTSIRRWAKDNFNVTSEEAENNDNSSSNDSSKKSTKRKRALIPQSIRDLDSDEEVESGETKKVKASSSNSVSVPEHTKVELTDAEIEFEMEKKFKTAVESYRGKPLVRADIYREGFHSLRCEYCNLRVQNSDELVNCATCPLSFHPDCADPPTPLSTQNWSCASCRESGVIGTQEFNAANGISLFMQSPWILVWSSSHKRWRPGCVYQIEPETGFVLLRWWRYDSKWGRENWVDLSDGRANWSALGINPLLKPKKSRTTTERKSSDSSAQRTNRRPVAATSPRPSDEIDDSLKLPQEPPQPELLPDLNIEMSTIDTFVSANSLKAAICAAGSACRAVDIVMCGTNTNVFCCMRPPGHHVGRRGFTEKCQGTGFCLLNNAAIAMLYARVRWGLKRVAVVDIDVHFGNGTSEILKGDPRAFFGCVHMIHGEGNEGFDETKYRCCPGASPKDSLGERFQHGFFPHALGCTQISENYISVGVYPESARNLEPVGTGSHRYGPSGFRSAISEVIIPNMERFDPELLIISAGFDGNKSDPLGGDFGLAASDYSWATHSLLAAISKPQASGRGRVISLLEGGYDVRKETQGLASSVDEHVKALRKHPPVFS